MKVKLNPIDAPPDTDRIILLYMLNEWHPAFYTNHHDLGWIVLDEEIFAKCDKRDFKGWIESPEVDDEA